MKYDKNSVFFINLYENHNIYGCHGNKNGHKNILVKKYNWEIRLSFYDALERTSKHPFFHKVWKTYME